MKLIGIKYCGGCNPLIDRRIGARDRKIAPVTDMSSTPWEIGILVCGCPIACADRPDVRGISKRWIRVGGSTVDLDSIQEDEMASVIVGKIDLLQTKR